MSIRRGLWLGLIALVVAGCATAPSPSSSLVSITTSAVDSNCESTLKVNCIQLIIHNNAAYPLLLPISRLGKCIVPYEPSYGFAEKESASVGAKWVKNVVSIGSYMAPTERLRVQPMEQEVLWVPLPQWSDNNQNRILKVWLLDENGESYLSTPFDALGRPQPDS